jgi:hypothetical protein
MRVPLYPHYRAARRAHPGVPGSYRESGARGTQNASGDRVRVKVCAAASQPTGRAVACVLCHACASHSLILSRTCRCHPADPRSSTTGLAERIRTPLFEPAGALSELNPLGQGWLKQRAALLAGVFQRSSSNVEGRNAYLSLRNHQLRGLGHPRKRACLTAVHNFFLMHPDGTTAAERFFGQKPRSMFAPISASVEISPAPLSPPRRAVG